MICMVAKPPRSQLDQVVELEDELALESLDGLFDDELSEEDDDDDDESSELFLPELLSLELVSPEPLSEDGAGEGLEFERVSFL